MNNKQDRRTNKDRPLTDASTRRKAKAHERSQSAQGSTGQSSKHDR
jgi:hypothetical protein